MAARTTRAGVEMETVADATVFDLAHLEHYAMGNQALAREVVSLFLAQLPLTLTSLEQAETLDDWRFAAHALKGSAMAVGARKLCDLASELESCPFPGEGDVRALRLATVAGAAAAFRDAARRAYPDCGA